MPRKYTYATPDPFKHLQDQLDELQRRMRQVEPGVYPEQWHNVGDPGEPAFQNGWSNYGGSSFKVGFMLGSNGVVHLRGAAALGVTNTAIFTLPSALYIPQSLYQFAAMSGSGDAELVTANPDGTIRAFNITTLYVSLDGLLFSTG